MKRVKYTKLHDPYRSVILRNSAKTLWNISKGRFNTKLWSCQYRISHHTDTMVPQLSHPLMGIHILAKRRLYVDKVPIKQSLWSKYNYFAQQNRLIKYLLQTWNFGVSRSCKITFVGIHRRLRMWMPFNVMKPFANYIYRVAPDFIG